jgi:hypothetical protein
LRDSGIIFDKPQGTQFRLIAQIVRSPAHLTTADPRLPHGLTREVGRL